ATAVRPRGVQAPRNHVGRRCCLRHRPRVLGVPPLPTPAHRPGNVVPGAERRRRRRRPPSAYPDGRDRGDRGLLLLLLLLRRWRFVVEVMEEGAAAVGAPLVVGNRAVAVGPGAASVLAAAAAVLGLLGDL
ncbi:unnamed protein product, partial [Ectocarpus sp. 4 AP-2014]